MLAPSSVCSETWEGPTQLALARVVGGLGREGRAQARGLVAFDHDGDDLGDAAVGHLRAIGGRGGRAARRQEEGGHGGGQPHDLHSRIGSSSETKGEISAPVRLAPT